jgi:hypothetical protein
MLHVKQNKIQLIDFICQTVTELEDYCRLLGKKRLVITGAEPIPIEVTNGQILARTDLKTTHEEADVIMVNQMLHLAHSRSNPIRVICDDTDVFILLVHFYASQDLSCNLTMESTSGNRTVIDIGDTVKQHQDVVRSILSCHVPTGCDTVARLS